MPKKNHSVTTTPPIDADAMQGLARRIAAQAENHAVFPTAISDLTLYRNDRPTKPTAYLLEPSACLILQGRKRVLLGPEDYSYEVGEFLVTSVGLPLVAEILEAAPAKPYVGLIMKLDRNEIARLVLDQHIPVAGSPRNRAGIEAGALTKPLFDAFRRLVELLDESENIPALAPIIQKEILFRLLQTAAGSRISRLATAGDSTTRINRIIAWINSNLATRLRVESLAELAGMSVSTLHHQFRALTTMSPLQYQKRLRLNEARQLMLTGRLDAATAAFKVGYESPSQFTREYARLFGNPPRRDIQNLLAATTGLD